MNPSSDFLYMYQKGDVKYVSINDVEMTYQGVTYVFIWNRMFAEWRYAEGSPRLDRSNDE